MPITSPLSLNPIRQQEFAQFDYVVMRHAFECQNQLGRLCDEQIYENDLAARLEAADVPVRTEVPVFRITALTEGTEDYVRHLRCLLGASPLRAMQWINLARKRVQFTSLIR
jgi:hypothetical protein